MKKYSEKEIQSVVAEVEEAIETLLKSEVAALQKAEEMGKDQKSGGEMNKMEDCPVPDMKKDEPSASMPPEASAPMDASKEVTAEASPSASPEASPMDAAPTEDELRQAYGELSDEELKMHMHCIEEVMAQKMGGMTPAPTDAPAMAPDASANPVAPANPELAMKSEKMAAELADLKKTMDVAIEALQLSFNRPQFKGVTGADVITKTETSATRLNKSEIWNKLLTVVKTDLKKSDRQLVKDYFNGKADANKIQHLLNA